MARTALTQLQDQIEAVRKEAYAAGYAAAMQSIREFAARPTAAAVTASPPSVRRRAAKPPARPRGRPAAAAKKPERPARRRPQRGTNARLITEVLQAMAPRAARPTEIRTALQKDKGVAMAFTSIRHALGQLEARHAVAPSADGKTWRLVEQNAS